MKHTIVLVAFLLLLTGCAQLPVESHFNAHQVNCGYGPEDIVLDTVAEKFRILISCDGRRKNEPQVGNIWTYDPATRSCAILPREGEPAGLPFHPHGIDLIKVGNEAQLLVISHDHPNHITYVLRYAVTSEKLVFKEKISDPLFTSPNALAGFADGSFLLSNDLHKAGSFWEMLFKQKKSTIVFWKEGKASVAADHIAFGNGIIIRGNQVYHASTMGNYVCRYDFQNGLLEHKTILAEVKGPDNLRFDGNYLTVACHPKFGKFISHMRDSATPSPTVIYRVPVAGGQPQVVYFNQGKQISAASTGLIYRKKLFIAQVFNPWILDVDLE
ncbi:MAG: hypothetical protein U0T84_01770 [Chitinophagales bacterium]